MEIFLIKVKKRICIILRFWVCKVSGPACSRGAHEIQSAVPGCGIQIQEGLHPPRNTLCEEGQELAPALCYPVNGGCLPGSSPVGRAVSIVDCCLMVLTSSSGSHPKSELLGCGSLVFMGFVFVFDFMFLVC